MTDTWTITSSPAMQAAETAAELAHLAQTAATDQALIGDDAGPHWRAVEHAEEVLSRVDATAMCTVQELDEQNDARGREIRRLRAQLATIRAFAEQDQDGSTCSHNVTGQLRHILSTMPRGSATSEEG
jgi:hypothetical protein